MGHREVKATLCNRVGSCKTGAQTKKKTAHQPGQKDKIEV
jgi:hypothetical protein